MFYFSRTMESPLEQGNQNSKENTAMSPLASIPENIIISLTNKDSLDIISFETMGTPVEDEYDICKRGALFGGDNAASKIFAYENTLNSLVTIESAVLTRAFFRNSCISLRYSQKM